MRRTVRRLACVGAALALTLGSCSSGKPGDRAAAPTPTGSVVRVASFDFPESRLLAELYAVALESHGYRVDRMLGLGAREVVEPALEQGQVDLLPEYLGTATDFLAGNGPGAGADPGTVHAELTRLFSGRGVTVLDYAQAQDRNGFAVTRDTARRLALRKISDLAGVSGELVFGGPPECPERPLCLRGLQDVYVLRFLEFRVMPTRAATAAALRDGEIDIGMLETTSGYLTDPQLVLLTDDRRMQPAENVVPVVRTALVQRLGRPFVDVVDRVTARLHLDDLVAMNRQADIEGQDPRAVATEWLLQQHLA